MHVRGKILLLVLGFTYVSAVDASAQHVNLLSSPRAFQEAKEIAKHNELPYLVTPAELRRQVERGELVKLAKEGDYVFTGSFPYAQPEAVEKIEEIATEFKRLCGRPLFVTSATRTALTQPKHAAHDSLHRTGIAFDLEIPREAHCRHWLESTLRFLERRKELFAWSARAPAHYHVVMNIDTSLPVEEAVVEEVVEEEKSTYLSFLPEMPSVSLRDLPVLLVELLLLVYIFWGGYRFFRRS